MAPEKPPKKTAYLPRSWGAGRREARRKRGGNLADDASKVFPRTDQVVDSELLPSREQREGPAADHSTIAVTNPGEGYVAESPYLIEPITELKEQERLESDEPVCEPHLLETPDSMLDEEPLGWLEAPLCEGALPGEATESDAQVSRVKVNIVGIRFGYACRVYHFDAGDMDLAMGEWVIVKTEKGLGLGQVALRPAEREISTAHLEGLRKVIRGAGKADFDQKARCTQREAEAYAYCMETIQTLNLPMKLVATECFFDGSKYVFYFTADGRVDFRELVKLLVARFPVRIEMRQIGVRHEAKMTGGLACCGQELCCSRFLTDFRPVSVKMAKTQNLSLNPTKISGVCGRLMCCLAYEYDTYEEFRKGLPKVGKRVNTAKGEGVVLKHDPLAEKVIIRVDEETTVEVTKEEIIADEGPPPPKRGKKKS